jgi:hypothetical protein
MDGVMPSRTRVLNYGLATFLVVLPTMILLYEWMF